MLNLVIFLAIVLVFSVISESIASQHVFSIKFAPQDQDDPAASEFAPDEFVGEDEGAAEEGGGDEGAAEEGGGDEGAAEEGGGDEGGFASIPSSTSINPNQTTNITNSTASSPTSNESASSLAIVT